MCIVVSCPVSIVVDLCVLFLVVFFLLLQLTCVYCCSFLVFIVVSFLVCIVVSCLASIVVVDLCVLL